MRFVLVILFLLVPASVSAQERGHLLAYFGASGQGRSTMLMIVTPSMVAINPREDGALVADLNGRTIRVWDANGNRFVDLGAAMRMAGAMGGSATMGDTSAVEAAQAQVAAQMEAMLEGIDPNQRAAVQAAIEGAVGISSGQLRPGTALSGGQQQRVGIASSLASDPELVLLDEPTPSYLGHDTVLARMLSPDGLPLRDYVLAPSEALPGVEEVLEILRQLQTLHIEITGSPIPPEAMLPDFPGLEPYGFPVAIEDFSADERWELGRLTGVTVSMDANGHPRWAEVE